MGPAGYVYHQITLKMVKYLRDVNLFLTNIYAQYTTRDIELMCNISELW
jgi:hypothetical protein